MELPIMGYASVTGNHIRPILARPTENHSCIMKEKADSLYAGVL